MRHYSLLLLVWAVVLGGASAPHAQEKAKLVEETWDAIYIQLPMQGNVLHGYVRTTVEERGDGDSKVLRGTQQMKLTFRRDGQNAEMQAEQGTDERADGLVTGIHFKVSLGTQQQLKRTGQLVGKQMEIKTEGQPTPDRSLNWNPVVLGLVREQNFLRDKKVKPGDSLKYFTYQPSINNVATVMVEVKQIEETDIPKEGKRKLLRVELIPEALEANPNGGPPIKHKLPGTTIWVDPATFKTVKSTSEMPGVGTLLLVRTTKDVATAPPGKVADFIAEQSIRLSDPIPNVHSANAVSLRIALKAADAEAKGLVREDARQRVRNIKGRTFDLEVEAVREPRKFDLLEKLPVAGEEYLKSNHFINSDDERVRDLAKKAVNGAKDEWERARKIERWVRMNMKPVDYSEALTTADHVAKTLSGDCTEYAMLTAAMCRAQGIPSRTALGVVYVDHAKHGPILAFHMWTEVFVKNQWLALDATLGRGSVGPGHIKITDHHWNGIQDFSPLLPVTRFILAKPAVEVISFRRSD